MKEGEGYTPGTYFRDRTSRLGTIAGDGSVLHRVFYLFILYFLFNFYFIFPLA